MGWLASIALKLFTGTTLSFLSSTLTALTNEHTAIVQAQTGLAAAEASAVVNAEIVRTQTIGQVMAAQMSHPIWWVGWTLFVIPPGLYDALIHLKSLACPFYVSACTWDIPRVPGVQESWDMYVVLSFFGLFMVSSVVTSIASRLGVVAK